MHRYSRLDHTEAKRKEHQFGCGGPFSDPVPRYEAFRSGARKGSVARAEEPNGARRPRGKLATVPTR